MSRQGYHFSTRHRVIVSRHSTAETVGAVVIVFVLIAAANGLLPLLIILGALAAGVYAIYCIMRDRAVAPQPAASPTPIPVWVTSAGVCSWCGTPPQTHVDASGAQMNLGDYHGVGGNTP